MIREFIGRWLVPEINLGGGPYAGSFVVSDIDWIDGPDEDDDEFAFEGFNEPTESEPVEDDEDE